MQRIDHFRKMSDVPGTFLRLASLWIFLVLVVFIGCEAKPRQSEVPTKQDPEIVDVSEIELSETKPNVATASIEPQPSVVDKKSEPKGAPSTQPKADSSQPTNLKSVSTAKIKKPEANPTPQQLEAWKWPEYTPIELLVAKESSQVGLVTCSARTKDGKYYILGGFKVALWSVSGTEPEHVFLQSSDGSKDIFVRSMSVSPDGKRLAAGDSEGMVRLWNLDDRTELVAKKLDSNDIVDLSFSPDSQSLATISFNNEVFVWSTDKLEVKSKWKVNTNGVSRIGFRTNDTLLALGQKASVWKVSSGVLERELDGDRYNMTLAYTNDRQSLVVGSEKNLSLWSGQDAEPKPFLQGAFASKELLAFSPDGASMASVDGRTIRIWDLPSKRCVQMIDIVGTAVVGLEWLPSSNLIVAIPSFGPVRVWGTPASGASAGLKPIHKPIVLPKASEKEIAFPNQFANIIDLRTFPLPPGVEPAVAMISTFNSEAAIKAEEAKLFYRYQLGQRGWMESTDPSTNPMSIEFRKDGFMLSSSFYEAGDSKTYLNLNHAGNLDMRTIPRPKGIATEETYSSEHTVMLRTKADILQIETALLREMHQAGWTAYSRMLTSHNEEPDMRNLTFLRDGIDLHISIQKLPDAPDQFSLSYARYLNTNTLPIPNDSGYVEFDGSTDPYLVATTSMSLDETQAFYDKEMDKQGWLPLTIGRTMKEENRWLPYLQNQKDVVIGIQKLKNGRTLIRVGNDLERSSWQLAKKPDETKQEATGEIRMQAADFPILAGAKDVKYDVSGKSIDFQVEGTTLAALAEQYTEALAEMGWKAEQGGIRSEEYTFFEFQKDKQDIAFRANSSQGKASVNIQGDGLLWTKELPGGKKIVSYEFWLRQNKHPATLDLIDRYISEMKALSAK